MTGSRLCKWSDFETPEYLDMLRELGRPFVARRKWWEEVSIVQAIDDRVTHNADIVGCGFGVGLEPIPAMFAEWGIPTLATDQAPSEEAKIWDNGQWCRGKEDLWQSWSTDRFERFVSFRTADMRAIPADLGSFDFVWSSSSLEHLGSLEAGISFLVESCRLLKPGGIAAHTTEFNLTSNDRTIDSGNVVIYRRRDLDALPDRLSAVGCTLDPIDYTLGDHEMDRLVDPMTDGKYDGKHVHLKLMLGEFAITSLLLVIRKTA